MLRVFFCTGTGTWKARKESVNLWKATAFLPFQTLHKLVDCPFHARSIRCRKKLLITVILRAWPVIPPLRVHPLRGTGRLLHHCIAMCSTKSCTYSVLYTGLYSLYWYVTVYLSLHWVNLSISKYILVHTVCVGMYQYISVYTILKQVYHSISCLYPSISYDTSQ